MKKRLYGQDVEVGIYSRNGKAYKCWVGIFERSYSERWHKRKPSYMGCKVHEDWHIFDSFKVWFLNNYVDGWHIDKDLLCKENKIYSADTCIFLPAELNSIITHKDVSASGLLPGVYYDHEYGMFNSETRARNKKKKGQRVHWEHEAFLNYKDDKERRVKEFAESLYRQRKISEKVYQALSAWELRINPKLHPAQVVAMLAKEGGIP